MFSDTQRRWLVLLAFLPVVIDMTILHIAVPSLTQALGASATEVLWIIDIYPLLMPGLLVAMGTLADRIGNRRVLLTDRACHLRDGFPAGRLCADASHAHQCTGAAGPSGRDDHAGCVWHHSLHLPRGK
ncbi:hypothetical protein [Aeromonas dhakensis]|uniref:hypothetical protein n=1 Tax=Aeromonas dhakensis TaxID=196024 RepID=UPI001C2C2024|nr:hypothetical protein [Aeromonas dhakensis]